MQIPLRILGLRFVVCAFSVIGANFACATGRKDRQIVHDKSDVNRSVELGAEAKENPQRHGSG